MNKPVRIRNPSVRSQLYQLGPFTDRFVVRLSSVNQYFQREAVRAGVDTRPGVIASLAAIAKNPGLSQTELSAITGKDKSLVVHMLHEITAQGLVVREKSETDRRRHALQITPAGRAALERNLSLLKEVERRLLKGMSPETVAELRQLLEDARLSCETSSALESGGDARGSGPSPDDSFLQERNG